MQTIASVIRTPGSDVDKYLNTYIATLTKRVPTGTLLPSLLNIWQDTRSADEKVCFTMGRAIFTFTDMKCILPRFWSGSSTFSRGQSDKPIELDYLPWSERLSSFSSKLLISVTTRSFLRYLRIICSQPSWTLLRNLMKQLSSHSSVDCTTGQSFHRRNRIMVSFHCPSSFGDILNLRPCMLAPARDLSGRKISLFRLMEGLLTKFKVGKNLHVLWYNY
jgi:hypothetical protein